MSTYTWIWSIQDRENRIFEIASEQEVQATVVFGGGWYDTITAITPSHFTRQNGSGHIIPSWMVSTWLCLATHRFSYHNRAHPWIARKILTEKAQYNTVLPLWHNPGYPAQDAQPLRLQETPHSLASPRFLNNIQDTYTSVVVAQSVNFLSQALDTRAHDDQYRVSMTRTAQPHERPASSYKN